VFAVAQLGRPELDPALQVLARGLEAAHEAQVAPVQLRGATQRAVDAQAGEAEAGQEEEADRGREQGGSVAVSQEGSGVGQQRRQDEGEEGRRVGGQGGDGARGHAGQHEGGEHPGQLAAAVVEEDGEDAPGETREGGLEREQETERPRRLPVRGQLPVPPPQPHPGRLEHQEAAQPRRERVAVGPAGQGRGREQGHEGVQPCQERLTAEQVEQEVGPRAVPRFVPRARGGERRSFPVRGSAHPVGCRSRFNDTGYGRSPFPNQEPNRFIGCRRTRSSGPALAPAAR
jgi:hypothetical protein